MKARKFARKMIDMISKPELRVLPGQLAFFIVMSFIPIVALISLFCNRMGIPFTEITFGGTIPKAVEEVINQYHTSGIQYNMIFFLVFGFFMASNGAHSMIISSNEIYKIKGSDIISRRIKAIFMTIIIVLLFIFLILVPVFGDSIFNLIKESVRDKQTVNMFYKIYKLLKYPLTIIILYFNIKLIYVMAPDQKITSNTTTKGALFTTIGWVITSEFYSLYTTYFVRYDIFYGSLSSLLVLLIWVYLLSYIFSLGLIINASSYDKNDIIEAEKKDRGKNEQVESKD